MALCPVCKSVLQRKHCDSSTCSWYLCADHGTVDPKLGLTMLGP